MKLQGRSDFIVETELNPDEIVGVVNRTLSDFVKRTPVVTRAWAETDDKSEITINIFTVSGSFAVLEQELDELAGEISTALLRRGDTTRVSRGVTEMITA